MIIVPVILSFVSLLVDKFSSWFRNIFCLAGVASAAIMGSYLVAYVNLNAVEHLSYNFAGLIFTVDRLNVFCVMFTNLMGLLILLYSFSYMPRYGRINWYYPLIVWAVVSASTALLMVDYIPFMVFWDFCTLALFFSIWVAGPLAHKAAWKTLLICASGDLAMMLAVLGIVLTTGSTKIGLIENVPGHLIGLFFALMFVSALTKAGGVPLHTWIPEMAWESPTTSLALFPASLDKILGIFKLTVICHMLILFSVSYSVAVATLGALTMIVGVMTAVVQHDIRRLLSYHAISQVGYMIMGIGIGTSLGIIGGLFHMVNHILYKSCLFLTAGAVLYATNIKDIDRLGGLAKKMPVTFACATVAALSISGVPPFNGFASKWIIYQAALEASKTNPLYIIYAVVGVVVSALTLASFVKYIHGVFLGSTRREIENVREVSWWMRIPMMILASGCIIFGVAPQIPLDNLISPAVGITIGKPSALQYGYGFYPMSTSIGMWGATVAASLMVMGIALGGLLYSISGRIQPKPTLPLSIEAAKPFLCGEDIPLSYSGGQFYGPFKRLFKPLYRVEELGGFDLILLAIAKPFRRIFKKPSHGAAGIYIVWVLLLLITISLAWR